MTRYCPQNIRDILRSGSSRGELFRQAKRLTSSSNTALYAPILYKSTLNLLQIHKFNSSTNSELPVKQLPN